MFFSSCWLRKWDWKVSHNKLKTGLCKTVKKIYSLDCELWCKHCHLDKQDVPVISVISVGLLYKALKWNPHSLIIWFQCSCFAKQYDSACYFGSYFLLNSLTEFVHVWMLNSMEPNLNLAGTLVVVRFFCDYTIVLVVSSYKKKHNHTWH